jgi:3-dehydroquinate synthase
VVAAWISAGLDRRSAVVALGGGVVGDLAGFVASIFMRGIPVVQVPTTLLAQVDASVGGKTGVNTDAGKNLIGTFHQPTFVYADIGTLATLDRRDLASGAAEAIKHALIADRAHFEWLERNAALVAAGEAQALAEIVARSCAIKAGVVAGDERETRADGGRATLNFGHTVGHAIESASFDGAAPLRHGEAVALGMLAALVIGVRLGATPEGMVGRVTTLLQKVGLPTDLVRWLTPSTLSRVRVDKKRAAERVSFVIVTDVGRCRIESLPTVKVEEILLEHAKIDTI